MASVAATDYEPHSDNQDNPANHTGKRQKAVLTTLLIGTFVVVLRGFIALCKPHLVAQAATASLLFTMSVGTVSVSSSSKNKPRINVTISPVGPPPLHGVLGRSGSSTVTPAGDQLFRLSINVEDVSDLFAFNLQLSFDQTVLDVVSANEGTFFNMNANYITAFEISQGTLISQENVFLTETLRLTDTLIDAPFGLIGSGTLATIDFVTRDVDQNTTAFLSIGLTDSTASTIVLGSTTIRGNELYPGGFDVAVATVPEPTSGLLLGTVLTVILFAKRRRERRFVRSQ